MKKKKPGKLRGGRVIIAQMGERAHSKATTKWLRKMQKEHPAEYAEAMRRIEERQNSK